MKIPLVFNEHGDVTLYWSAERAATAIEAIDVKNNEYVAYDATGRRLAIDLKGNSVLGIRLADDPTEHVHELTAALKRYLRSISPGSHLDDLSIAQLLQLVPQESSPTVRRHPYAWRTRLRRHLPWFLINLGIADKGEDCEAVGAKHDWYNQDGANSGCYHCRVVRPGQLWRPESN